MNTEERGPPEEPVGRRAPESESAHQEGQKEVASKHAAAGETVPLPMHITTDSSGKQGPVTVLEGRLRDQAAIATAPMLFWLSSGAALATVVGVLIEVPVMLMLVRICLKTNAWFPKDA